jgi:hypothetical protein
MFWADHIVEALERYRHAPGDEFVLSPLPARCAAEGKPLDRQTGGKN